MKTQHYINNRTWNNNGARLRPMVEWSAGRVCCNCWNNRRIVRHWLVLVWCVQKERLCAPTCRVCRLPSYEGHERKLSVPLTLCHHGSYGLGFGWERREKKNIYMYNRPCVRASARLTPCNNRAFFVFISRSHLTAGPYGRCDVARYDRRELFGRRVATPYAFLFMYLKWF